METRPAQSGARITALRPARGDPMRCAVKVGRRMVATLSLDAAEALGLEVGLLWDEPLARRVEAAAEEDRARRDAMRVVNKRMIGTGELRDRLLRRGHAEASIERVVAELTERGLLDDAAYGRAIIGEALAARPAGRRLLAQRLARRKLDPALIAELLDRAEAEALTDPVADARRLAERKLATPALRRAAPAARYRRAASLLARRGFDEHAIQDALAHLLDEPPTD